MNEPLQEFDWKKSTYERPSHNWVCGHSCDGLPCRLGPSSKGKCQVNNQCLPEKKGDRYLCTRAPVDGGKCKEGPAPDGTCCQLDTSCQPHRNLFAKRRILGVLTTVAALSFCFYLFSGSAPSSILIPGDVTTAHAVIESDCSSCHTAGDGGLTMWVQTALNGEVALKDSALCLKCHSELGEYALHAHNVSPQLLAKKTEQIKKFHHATSTPLALQLSPLTGHAALNQKLTCATCHREHHGRESNLTHLTDLQCQTCHTQQFESFEHGHPELGDYPHQRRTRIYFDHSAHLNRYFKDEDFKRTMPNGQVPKSCNSCHSSDAAGRVILTGSFEKNCASCHAPQIEDVEFPAIPFFALPVFDPILISSLGEWSHNQGTMSTPHLPQLMEQLLTSDPHYQHAIKQLGKVDYRKLNSRNPNHHAAISELAWSIKQLFYDISTQGASALEQRLDNKSSAYLNLKPSIIPTIIQAQKAWFPHLHTEMKLHQKKEPLPSPVKSEIQNELEENLTDSTTGWSISKSDFTIRYRPIGHSDPLIKHWLDKTVANNENFPLNDNMWKLISNPVGSGTEETGGALSSGRCLMCHSVERETANGDVKINWYSLNTKQTEEQLTQFTHTAHLLNTEKNKCIICHVIDNTRTPNSPTFKKDYFLRDATNSYWQINLNSQQPCSSGFHPINRKTCATCHTKKSANQSCLQCHNYHIHQKKLKID